VATKRKYAADKKQKETAQKGKAAAESSPPDVPGAKDLGCFYDSYKKVEFPWAAREKDLSIPPEPFSTTKCIQRCRDRGMRYAAIRMEDDAAVAPAKVNGPAPWWVESSNTIARASILKATLPRPRKERVIEVQDDTGKTMKFANSARLIPFGAMAGCICSNKPPGRGGYGMPVDKHGKPACPKQCDQQETHRAFAFGALGGTMEPYAPTCTLPCPKCWYVAPGGSWQGGDVGESCGGKSCVGLPYSRCKEFKYKDCIDSRCKKFKWKEFAGFKDGIDCPQGPWCGFGQAFGLWDGAYRGRRPYKYPFGGNPKKVLARGLQPCAETMQCTKTDAEGKIKPTYCPWCSSGPDGRCEERCTPNNSKKKPGDTGGAYWNSKQVQPNSRCGSVASSWGKSDQRKFINVVYEVDGYETKSKLSGKVHHTVVACNGQVLTMKCDKDQSRVKIMQSFYGRVKNSKMCGTEEGGCEQNAENDVTLRVSKVCDTARKCQVLACADCFGLKKCNLDQQHLVLNVTYTCVAPTSSHQAVPTQSQNKREQASKTTVVSALQLGHYTKVTFSNPNIPTTVACVNGSFVRTKSQTGKQWSVRKAFDVSKQSTYLNKHMWVVCPAPALCLQGNGLPVGLLKRDLKVKYNKGLPASTAFPYTLPTEVGICMLPGCLHYSTSGTQSSTTNKCFLPGLLKHSQTVLECTNTVDDTALCGQTMDGRDDTGVRFKVSPTAAVTVQYPTTRQLVAVDLLWPPTAEGGTKTPESNVFYFNIECHGKGGWRTVLSTDPAQSKKKDAKHRRQMAKDRYPGVKSFAVSEKCSSTTWRLTKFKSPFHNSIKFFSITNIDLLMTGIKDVATKLPRLSTVASTVSANSDAITTTTTTLPSATATLASKGQSTTPDVSVTCIGMQQEHPVFGAIACSNLVDRDTNTPAIFQKDVPVLYSDPYIAAATQAPESFDSIWIYHNPVNIVHNSSKGSVWRLRAFDVQCLTDGDWKVVLNQSSSHGKSQLQKAVGKKATELEQPCTSCWMQFNFEHKCTSNQWRITHLNPGSVFPVQIFELQFGRSSQPPTLPVPKEPRVQGWCVRHQHVPIGDGTSFTTPRKASGSFTAASFKTPLRDVPCGSELVIGLTSVNTMLRRGSASSKGATLLTTISQPGGRTVLQGKPTSVRGGIQTESCPLKQGIKPTSCNFGKATINGLRGGWLHPRCNTVVANLGHGDQVSGWIKKNGPQKWVGCASGQTKKEQGELTAVHTCKKIKTTIGDKIAGRDTTCTGVNDCGGTKYGWGCMHGLTNFASARLDLARNQTKLSIFGRVVPAGEQLEWKHQGHYKISYWWKPPLPDMKCSITPGQLEYTNEGLELPNKGKHVLVEARQGALPKGKEGPGPISSTPGATIATSAGCGAAFSSGYAAGVDAKPEISKPGTTSSTPGATIATSEGCKAAFSSGYAAGAKAKPKESTARQS